MAKNIRVEVNKDTIIMTDDVSKIPAIKKKFAKYFNKKTEDELDNDAEGDSIYIKDRVNTIDEDY